MKLIKEAKLKERVDEEDRKWALVKFLGLTNEEVENLEVSKYDETQFEYGREEYLVLTDDEVDEKFKEYQRDLLDDIGLEGVSKSFLDWIMNNAVDDKSFWKDMENDIYTWIEESPDSYSSYFDIDDVKEELFKLYKKGKLSPSDFDVDEDDFEDKKELDKEVSSAIDYLDDDEVLNLAKDNDVLDIDDAVETYIKEQNTPYSFLKDMYGEGEELFEVLKPYIDMDDVIDEILKQNGRSSLAGYDGEENEVKVENEYFYIYRTN